jgi:hypothetical protein
MASDVQIDHEILQVVGIMLHDLGHVALDLRTEVALLEKEFPSVATSKRLSRISGAADRIQDYVRSVRFLFSEDESVDCNFVTDILEPVILWTRRPADRIRVATDQSVRNAPTITVRPRFLMWALRLLLSALQPKSIRCRAEHLPNRITFCFRLEGKFKASLSRPLQERLISLFEAAGAPLSLSLEENEFSIRCRLEA